MRKNDPLLPDLEEEDGVPPGSRLYWTRGFSLTARILFVNVIALALLAGSLFYIDSYRKQLLEERFKLARSEAEIAADALAEAPPSQYRALLARIGREQELRLRLYDAEGDLQLDSFAIGGPAFTLINPESEDWYQQAARILDRGVDFIVGAPNIPDYREPAANDPQARSVAAWPELMSSRQTLRTTVQLRYAPDRTPVISAAVPVGDGTSLLTTRNARDITQAIRDARQTLAIIVGLALLLSVQLSLFLAQTIVQPLRALVRAAVRVRLGRDREVVVPRLPERRDEIGMLARAFSDMTNALRLRIDAGEAFAADVAHELKNPLASLRSALESLDKVTDADLRQQLLAIAAHDVQRIDRLITEIADASRIDAELSRATFEAVDLAALAERLVGARGALGEGGKARIAFHRGVGGAIVWGDAARLERVLENLIDNAVSFSPAGGLVDVTVWGDAEQVTLSVIDEGPGVPEHAREKVFERFHSDRPADEAFGSHSGLGLAIARAIATAHDGTLTIIDRPDGQSGACLVLELPAANP